MVTAGIDCGAKNTKTIIMKDGKIIEKGIVLTGFDQEKAVEGSLEQAIQSAGISKDDIQRICGTGSGKNAFKVADDEVNDIKAMSKGAHFFFPNARTVTDVGAEEGRAVKIDEIGNPVGTPFTFKHSFWGFHITLWEKLKERLQDVNPEINKVESGLVQS